MVRFDRFVIAVLAFALVPFAAASGQAEARTEAAGAATPSPTPPAAKPRADLSEVNELVLEGSYAEAEGLLAALQTEFPEDPALLLLRGEVLLAGRKAEEARGVLESSLKLDPDQPRANFQLATALTALGQTTEALARFDAAANSGDDQIKLMARLNRSTLFAQSRQWTEAALELEEVLELQPTNAQVYGDLASMYLRAGKTSESAAALERGKQVGFRSAEHHYSLGARLYRDNDHPAAIEALQAALALEPGMAKAELSLAAALEKLGRDDEALVHLRRYLDLAPDADDAEQIAAKIQRAKASR